MSLHNSTHQKCTDCKKEFPPGAFIRIGGHSRSFTKTCLKCRNRNRRSKEQSLAAGTSGAASRTRSRRTSRGRPEAAAPTSDAFAAVQSSDAIVRDLPVHTPDHDDRQAGLARPQSADSDNSDLFNQTATILEPTARNHGHALGAAQSCPASSADLGVLGTNPHCQTLARPLEAGPVAQATTNPSPLQESTAGIREVNAIFEQCNASLRSLARNYGDAAFLSASCFFIQQCTRGSLGDSTHVSKRFEDRANAGHSPVRFLWYFMKAFDDTLDPRTNELLQELKVLIQRPEIPDAYNPPSCPIREPAFTVALQKTPFPADNDRFALFTGNEWWLEMSLDVELPSGTYGFYAYWLPLGAAYRDLLACGPVRKPLPECRLYRVGRAASARYARGGTKMDKVMEEGATNEEKRWDPPFDRWHRERIGKYTVSSPSEHVRLHIHRPEFGGWPAMPPFIFGGAAIQKMPEEQPVTATTPLDMPGIVPLQDWTQLFNQ